MKCVSSRDTENERQKVREDKATVLIMEELVLEVIMCRVYVD